MEIRNIKIGTPIQTIMSKDVLRISLKHLRIFSLNTKIRRSLKKSVRRLRRDKKSFNGDWMRNVSEIRAGFANTFKRDETNSSNTVLKFWAFFLLTFSLKNVLRKMV